MPPPAWPQVVHHFNKIDEDGRTITNDQGLSIRAKSTEQAIAQGEPSCTRPGNPATGAGFSGRVSDVLLKRGEILAGMFCARPRVTNNALRQATARRRPGWWRTAPERSCRSAAGRSRWAALKR